MVLQGDKDPKRARVGRKLKEIGRVVFCFQQEAEQQEQHAQVGCTSNSSVGRATVWKTVGRRIVSGFEQKSKVCSCVGCKWSKSSRRKANGDSPESQAEEDCQRKRHRVCKPELLARQVVTKLTSRST